MLLLETLFNSEFMRCMFIGVTLVCGGKYETDQAGAQHIYEVEESMVPDVWRHSTAQCITTITVVCSSRSGSVLTHVSEQSRQ